MDCARPPSRLTSTDDTPVSASTALPVIVTSVRARAPDDGALTVSAGGSDVGPDDRQLADPVASPGLGADHFDRGRAVADMECELETAFLVGFHHLLDRAVGPEVELQLGPGSQLAADDGCAVGPRRFDQ